MKNKNKSEIISKYFAQDHEVILDDLITFYERCKNEGITSIGDEEVISIDGLSLQYTNYNNALKSRLGISKKEFLAQFGVFRTPDRRYLNLVCTNRLYVPEKHRSLFPKENFDGITYQGPKKNQEPVEKLRVNFSLKEAFYAFARHVNDTGVVVLSDIKRLQSIDSKKIIDLHLFQQALKQTYFETQDFQNLTDEVNEVIGGDIISPKAPIVSVTKFIDHFRFATGNNANEKLNKGDIQKLYRNGLMASFR